MFRLIKLLSLLRLLRLSRLVRYITQWQEVCPSVRLSVRLSLSLSVCVCVCVCLRDRQTGAKCENPQSQTGPVGRPVPAPVCADVTAEMFGL